MSEEVTTEQNEMSVKFENKAAEERKIRRKVIDDALKRNINLSPEDYKKIVMDSDDATAGHGIETKAPISESTRFKRMQMNQMGISLDIMLSMEAELNFIHQELQELNQIQTFMKATMLEANFMRKLITEIAREKGIDINKLLNPIVKGEEKHGNESNGK